MRFGIAAKLACLLALFGVLACGLTGYYSYASSRNLILKAAERDLLTAAQVLGRNLRTSIDGSSRDVRLLAQIAGASDLSAAAEAEQREQNENDLAELFQALLRVHPEYLQVRLISAAGHGLEQVRVDRDGDVPLQVRGAELQEKGHFAYVFETLRLAPGEVRLAPIAINRELGAHAGQDRPTLRVSSPVGGDGRPHGLVVLDIDLEQLFAQLRSDLPQHYQVYLSNRWGDLLIHPDSRRTFGFELGRRYFLQDEFTEAARLLRGEAEDGLIGRSLSSGQRLLAAFVRLGLEADTPERFVVLGLGQTEQQVLEAVSQLGQRIAQVVALASLLAVLIAIVASRAMTRSLKSINQAVRQFASERRSSPLPVQRKDELGELARSVEQMQEEIRDQLEALDQGRVALEHLARHDALTGLPNRRMFFERLEHALASARRNAHPLAVLFVDLDHFKQLNDSLGHSIGDRVLQAVANLLRSTTRESDTVARLGGDEFVVLLEQMDDPHQVISVLHKLHERFQLPMLLDGHEVRVQASIGVSLFPRDGDDIESLLQQADRAMYAAKNAGRNTYNFEADERR